jgi:hypothetical protein
MGLPGQEEGHAAADLLFGSAYPAGACTYWAQPETVAAAVLGRFVLAACGAYHRQYCVREAYITQPNMSRAVDTPCTMLAVANSEAPALFVFGSFCKLTMKQAAMHATRQQWVRVRFQANCR